MWQYAVRLSFVLVVALASCVPTNAQEAADLKRVNIKYFHVTLLVPEGWREDYEEPHRYYGDVGYVRFFATGGLGTTLEQSVATLSDAIKERYPYGTEPTVEATTAAGQPARLIVSSADYYQMMPKDPAALVGRLPRAGDARRRYDEHASGAPGRQEPRACPGRKPAFVDASPAPAGWPTSTPWVTPTRPGASASHTPAP